MHSWSDVNGDEYGTVSEQAATLYHSALQHRAMASNDDSATVDHTASPVDHLSKGRVEGWRQHVAHAHAGGLIVIPRFYQNDVKTRSSPVIAVKSQADIDALRRNICATFGLDTITAKDALEKLTEDAVNARQFCSARHHTRSDDGPQKYFDERKLIRENVVHCLAQLGYYRNITASFELPAAERTAIFLEPLKVQLTDYTKPSQEFDDYLSRASESIDESNEPKELQVFAYNWCLAKGVHSGLRTASAGAVCHRRLARSASGARVICKNCWDALTRKVRKAVANEWEGERRSLPWTPAANQHREPSQAGSWERSASSPAGHG